MRTHTKSLVRALAAWTLNGALAACLLWAVRNQLVNAGEPVPYECCGAYTGCAESCGWDKQVQEWVTVAPVQYEGCTAASSYNEQCTTGPGEVPCGTWSGYIDSGCETASGLSGTAYTGGCSDTCAQTA